MNLSDKIDFATVEVLRTFDHVARSRSLPYLLVGATARDMVLHHGHGIRLERATSDIDMAIQIANWAVFENVRDALIGMGYTTTGHALHRLMSPQGLPLDVVPFGGIENNNTQHISWPPDGERLMNMMGFVEACHDAQTIVIHDDPLLAVPVATPTGMALLKLVAWTDRSPDKRKRDAQDFLYLLKHNESMPGIRDRSYDDNGIMEQYSWDIRLAGAHLLGVDAAAIARPPTKQHIEALLTGKLSAEQRNVDRLVHESMDRFNEMEQTANFLLTEAFRNGFCQP
jgi:predicted nucleotidyltransferase